MSDRRPTVRAIPIRTVPADAFPIGILSTSSEAKSTSTLVEITVPQPASSALALVFDLSDSCRLTTRELDKLKKLLDGLPRRWEVWSYALSSSTPLYPPGEHSLAHIQDGSLELEDLLSDELRRRQAMRGSFLRPVLAEIERERSSRDLAGVTVLVITDGELSDGFACVVPSPLSVIGVAHQEATSKVEWNQVLPAWPLFTVFDPDLMRRLNEFVEPLYGHCDVEVQGLEGSAAQVLLWNQPKRTVGCWEASKGTWNFIDGPLRLILNSAAASITGVRFRCTPFKTRNSVFLSAADALKQIDPVVISQAEADCASQHLASGAFVLDVESSNPAFAGVRQAVAEAAGLSEKRQGWIDEQGNLSLFGDCPFVSSQFSVEGKAKFDAILCLTNVAATAAANRIVLVGLERQAGPALRWSEGKVLSFTTPAADLIVEFEIMQSRWYLRIGDRSAQREELNPRGSQKVARSWPAADGSHWYLFFSGDLRQRR